MLFRGFETGYPAPPDLTRLSPIFLALHLLGGHIGLPILIATSLLSKTVFRHPTLINFLCTWVFYSVSFCLTLYAGKAANASPALCQIQSVLIHGTLPMCATASLIIIIQIWTIFHQPELGVNRWSYTPWMCIKLGLPYIAFLIFTLLTAILQSQYPTFVNASNGLYCTFYKIIPLQFGGSAYCLITAILLLGVEIAIVVRYYYLWRRVSTVFPLANRIVSPVLIIRLSLFNVYSVVSLGAGAAFVTSNTEWSFMIHAGVPLVVTLVFGSSKDLFVTWCFWKKKRKPGQNSNDTHGMPGSTDSDILPQAMPALVNHGTRADS